VRLAGAKRAEAVDPALTAALERLVDPDVRGDPESHPLLVLATRRGLVREHRLVVSVVILDVVGRRARLQHRLASQHR
jgi:plasmid stabilization system protein ParE